METIPQRELRNNSGKVLREAEAGKEFAITVHGRPVASLGPYRRRQWISRAEMEKILATPTDESVLDDILAFEEGTLTDPWEPRN